VAVQSSSPLARVAVAARRGLRRVARAAWRNKMTTAAVVFLVLVVLAAILAIFLGIASSGGLDVPNRNQPPFSSAGGFHILGTDSLGRDMLGQLMRGAQVSLIVCIASVAVSGTIGVALGLVSGYFGRWVDDLVMRLVDLQMSIPSLLVALLVLYILGPSLTNVVVVLSITRWMVYARVTRGQLLALKQVPFIESARALGAGHRRIMFRHMLPNVAGPIVVVGTIELALMLLTEASLDFLGLGIQPPETSWGLMLSDGQQYLTSAWWLVAFPGLAIMLTSLAINLVATAIRSHLNMAGLQGAEDGAVVINEELNR
jgi:peptide/nickel transport system permease protein